MKKILQWMATDGLLHFLMCYAMMLTLIPLVGIVWSITITIIIALFKEFYDVFIEKDNNFSQAIHDLICDGIGVLMAIIICIVV